MGELKPQILKCEFCPRRAYLETVTLHGVKYEACPECAGGIKAQQERKRNRKPYIPEE